MRGSNLVYGGGRFSRAFTLPATQWDRIYAAYRLLVVHPNQLKEMVTLQEVPAPR